MKRFTANIDRKEAHRIVSLIARGADPDKPDQRPTADVLERPGVIRALFLASEALNSSTDTLDTTKEVRKGKPWSKDENDELRWEISQNESLEAIAAKHGRSEGGIVARMVHIGLAEDRDAARSFFRKAKNYSSQSVSAQT
jgi:hypothetical protein